MIFSISRADRYINISIWIPCIIVYRWCFHGDCYRPSALKTVTLELYQLTHFVQSRTRAVALEKWIGDWTTPLCPVP